RLPGVGGPPGARPGVLARAAGRPARRDGPPPRPRAGPRRRGGPGRAAPVRRRPAARPHAGGGGPAPPERPLVQLAPGRGPGAGRRHRSHAALPALAAVAAVTVVRAASHLHSDWSDDGSWTLPDLAAGLGERGYDVLLMTEHSRGWSADRWQDFRAACAEVSSERQLVVP